MAKHFAINFKVDVYCLSLPVYVLDVGVQQHSGSRVQVPAKCVIDKCGRALIIIQEIYVRNSKKRPKLR